MSKILPTLKNQYLLALLAGCIYGLTFPTKYTNGIPGSGIIGTALFFTLLSICRKGQTLKKDLAITAIFTTSMSLVSGYWVIYALEEFSRLTSLRAYLTFGVLHFYAQPIFIFFILLYRGIKATARLQTTLSIPMRNCMIAVLWAFTEHYSHQVFLNYLGYDWLMLAPRLGLAPVFGTTAFSFTSCWIALSLASFYKNKEKDLWAPAFLAVFLLANILVPMNPKPDTPPTITNLRIVQSNIVYKARTTTDIEKKEAQRMVDRRLWQLSTKHSVYPLDLILWPETSLYNTLKSYQIKSNPNFIPQIIKRVTNATGANLLAGGSDHNPAPNKEANANYNASFLFSSQGLLKNIYHKIKLVPFGETLPFGKFNKFIAEHLFPVSLAPKGKHHPLFETKSGSTFISLICYEIVFPRVVRRYLNNTPTYPHFIVNQTNDTWYGNSSEPYQHKWVALWKAVEFNLPVVRVNNSGISSVLYPDGSESKQIGLFKEDAMDIALETYPRQETIYARFGILPLLFLIVILLSLIGITTKVYSREK